MRDRLIELIQKEVPRPKADSLVNTILADGWIRPPYKVGDTVYYLARNIHTHIEKVKSGKVVRIAITESGIDLFVDNYVAKLPYGKRSFLTKEEAEAKLKEREGK